MGSKSSGVDAFINVTLLKILFKKKRYLNVIINNSFTLSRLKNKLRKVGKLINSPRFMLLCARNELYIVQDYNKLKDKYLLITQWL